jgi:hypothetical protein
MTKEKTFSFWKKILITIVALIAVFLAVILVIIIYLIATKPFGIDVFKIPSALLNRGDAVSSYDHPMLTKDQEVLLESVGVDLATLPTNITPSQEACAIEALGMERVNEIKSGVYPGIGDFLTARKCFE